MKHLILFLALTITCATVNAQSRSKKSPLRWPDNKISKAQFSFKETNFDGMIFSEYVVKHPELTLISGQFSDWRLSNSLTNRTASLVFVHEKNHDIKVGITVLKKGTWLPDLETDTLQRYADSIFQKHKENFTLYSPERNFLALPDTPFFAGNPYHLVHYYTKTLPLELSPIEEENTPIETVYWDFFCIEEKTEAMIILSYECPKHLESRNSANAVAIMASFHIDYNDDLAMDNSDD